LLPALAIAQQVRSSIPANEAEDLLRAELQCRRACFETRLAGAPQHEVI